jgi:RimJ/RimL family protein N-acetyltransferase
MEEIQTERLRIMALTTEQLALYLEDRPKLERALGFPVSQAVVSTTVRQAMGVKVSNMTQTYEQRHAWYTYWLMIVPSRHFGAGLIGFKGYPTAMGEVEIGYGIDPKFRNKGYMTEAVKAMVAWAFAAPEGVSAVIAETKKSNIASQRVLEKVGMRMYQELDDRLLWRLDKR